MSKLDELLAEIRACRLCVQAPQGRPLPHEPRPVLRASRTARIAICGQAPGTRVHASGIPFTDASGDRLRDWMGVTAQEFYDTARVAIVPMGFCFPGTDAKGGDLPPRKECGPQWQTRVFAAMPRIELLLLVGLYAQRWHLGRERVKQGLTATVRNWSDHGGADGRPVTLPLPHPSWRNTAWIKANPWFEAELLPVLRSQVRQRLG